MCLLSKNVAKTFGMFIYQLLRNYAQYSGRNTAIINVETQDQITYQELFQKSVGITELLKSAQHVAICSENNVNYFIPVLGCLYSGRPIAMISSSYRKFELLNALKTTQPTVIFCSRATEELITSVCRENDLNNIEKIITLEDIDYTLDYEQILEATCHYSDDSVAAMLFSSGTTGLAKAVELMHRNFTYFYELFQDETLAYHNCLNTIIIVPFAHAYGLILGLNTLANGSTIKFMAKFNEDIYLKQVKKHQVSCLSLVPPLMVWLAKNPKINQDHFESVRYACFGGASLSDADLATVIKRFPKIKLYQIYGMTELTLSATSTPLHADPKKIGSVGKANPGVNIKIRDAIAGEIGEILVSGPNVAKGYYMNPTETANTFLSDGFVATGDLGYLDEDGYLYIVDRVKDLIKYNAFQVPPAELEALLLTHEDVLEAAVVGLKDGVHGELPFAFVVKRRGSEVTASDLQLFIRKQVSYPKYLRGGVRFVDGIPKTAIGKLLRRELKELINNEFTNYA